MGRYTWNREQLSKLRNDDGNVTDAWRNGFREVLGTCLPYTLLVLAMVSKLNFKISVRVRRLFVVAMQGRGQDRTKQRCTLEAGSRRTKVHTH